MAQELTNQNSELPLFKHRQPMSGWIMLIFWWAMILVALHASTHMVGAGDTWVAMACGRHFINHGVDTVEPFSANSHKAGPTEADIEKWPNWAQWITDKVGLETVQKWHPTGWVNQNWLTHVFFYWLTHDSPIADAETFDKPIVEQDISYNSLVYWKYALYIVTIIVVYYTGRVLGANMALSATFACFALFIGRTFFDIRPAGFSNMLTAVLLFIFVLAVYKNYLYIWLIVPLTVLWCNLHGGYVYVFIVLVPFIGLHLLTLLPKRISLAVYFSLGWLFFYALSVKFHSHENLEAIKASSDVLLFFVLIAAAISLVMGFVKNLHAGAFYGYHLFISLIVFIAAAARFYPAGIERYISYNSLFAEYVSDSRQSFFVAFIGFTIIAMLLSAFRQMLQTISVKAWGHTVAAAAVAFVAMIIFNPFHLTNLTHTFEVSVSEHAKMWKTVNEWHPAFEWSNPVGDEIPFLIMYIAAWLLLVFWGIFLLLKPKIVVKKGKQQSETPDTQQYQWPKIDLPLLVIAALTIYMAIGSRRFIPIAAIAACPILAMFIDSSIRMFVAGSNLKWKGKAVLSPFPIGAQRALAAAALVIVILLTLWWGYWYKLIYLNPWPDSNFLTSVFMRMSASYAKPFKACQFVRDNEMKGTVFNYWTEGGFIAYGQIPDPNTGKTPLQLYMDGRAQAAYNTEAYQRWMYIMSGGDPVRAAERAGRELTPSDYEKVGLWLEEQFKKENVWVVFMPAAQFDSVLIRGLATNQNWRPAYIDDEQEIYVDVNTPQGRQLYTGIFNGQTKFPDEFSKLLTTGYNLPRLQQGDANTAFNALNNALKLKPSNTAAIELIRLTQYQSEFRPKVTEIFTEYFNDYRANKDKYKKQDGYRDRLMVTMIVGNYLANVNPAFKQEYQEYTVEFNRELQRISETSRW
ncbi:MAG: hypothetical protein A2Y10_04390 [Planctomycetes bacterium GWF2_41_51]|nr:MAG: hypothetical protein A2Y10_04390 [Planctomycetes bacterium GWF2_41_51]HBG27024.1 hypothetical protein [Phycisphaerales bacterium]